MDILGRMVGAPGPTPAELAETRTDAELIAEIAPAMLKKLREDGSTKGYWMGSNFFNVWVVFLVADVGLEQFDPAKRFVSPDTHLGLLVVAAAALILLPLYFKKRSVKAEITYRRKHGKWRWVA